jgi:hypothetical protein
MHTSATPDIIKELYRIDMTAEWPKNTNTEVALARQAIGAQDDDFQVREGPTRVRIYNSSSLR